MSDNDRSDWFWSFITGVLIALSFKLVWWVIKMTWRLLVWLCRTAASLLRQRKAVGKLELLEHADDLARMGRGEEALQIIQGVLDSGDEMVRPYAYQSLGDALETMERWDEAIEAYDRAIPLGVADMTALSILGKADCLSLGKRHRAAAAELYRQLAVPEENDMSQQEMSVSMARQAMHGLANNYYEGGQLVEADQFCERFARSGDHLNSVRSRIGRARIAAKQGRTADALALVDGLSEDDVAQFAGLRYELYRVDDFDLFLAELQGGRELSASA